MIKRLIKRPGKGFSRLGFSLIELIVVVLLMGILASMTTISVRGAIVRGRLTRAADLVQRFDVALRRAARSERRPVVGQIDRKRGRLTIDAGGNEPRLITLPKHVLIETIRFRASTGSSRSNRIIADRDGASPTYALRLSSGGSQRWVLLVGGTGQVIHGLDSVSVNSFLAFR